MANSAETYINNEQQYQFVDAIPEVAAAREDRRVYALGLIESRRSLPSTEGLPLPIDALSTGRKVLEVEREFGEDSSEYQERYDGLLLDCKRLVAEWWRKKKPEYFPQTRHFFDETVQEFFSHGWSIRQMTENGLSPQTNNPEEEARRVNEYVEDATPQIVRNLGGFALASEVSLRTISECTDKAIEDYQVHVEGESKHLGYNGYVPEIKKVMIRDITLDTETDDRFEEQVGIPGQYITHEIIQQALGLRGANANDIDKTHLHGSQFFAKDNLLDFVALLDSVATEEWCTEVFMGEEVAQGTVKDYQSFKHEALERQTQQAEIAVSVATYVLDLAEDETIDRKQAPAMVEEWVKMLLLGEAKKDLGVAEQMFDHATAAGLQEVLRLESLGRFEEANIYEKEVIENAPGGGFCGAGSCGLEAVAKQSEIEEKAHKLGLKGDLIKDKVRTCPDCHKKTIVYDKAANKGCLSCGLVRLNGKTSKVDIEKINKPKKTAETSPNPNAKITPESQIVSKVTKVPAVV